MEVLDEGDTGAALASDRPLQSQGFSHTRLVRGEVQVSRAELDGVIGGHDAGSRQLLVVCAAGWRCQATKFRRLELLAGAPPQNARPGIAAGQRIAVLAA